MNEESLKGNQDSNVCDVIFATNGVILQKIAGRKRRKASEVRRKSRIQPLKRIEIWLVQW